MEVFEHLPNLLDVISTCDSHLMHDLYLKSRNPTYFSLVNIPTLCATATFTCICHFANVIYVDEAASMFGI